MSFVPHSDADRAEMLAAAGVSSVDELYSDIPEGIRLNQPLDLPAALSEWEAVRLLDSYASENLPLLSFAGAGIYDHHIPVAVDHLIRRSEFYTAYTPYQPEVSQGTLQSIYEFQTMVCELTGMDVANASMYDGASAAAEAILVALSATRRNRVVVAGGLHKHYRRVLRTYLAGKEIDVSRVPIGSGGRVDAAAVTEALDDQTAALIIQNPNFYGVIEEVEPLAAAAHEHGALVIVVVADPLSLALLKTPGECGADLVAAEGQAFGNTPNFGGPVVGLFAATQKLIRKMPGRIVGATTDVEGRRGYVLTLQTREQQIRREKATSNICTNQGLNALAATIHLALVGREGLREVALASVQNAHYAHTALTEAGLEPVFPEAPFFREFAIKTGRPGQDVVRDGLNEGLLAGVYLSRMPGLGVEDGLLLAFTEKHRKDDIDRLVAFLSVASGG
jgi:glycine dehydrogenase subunit 1